MPSKPFWECVQRFVAHRTMQKVKSISAGLLLLLGFWCLGRAVETRLNRNPNILDQRETITAGLLLGLPAVTGGSWLLWDVRRQRRQQAEHRLRQIFFDLVQTHRGQVSPLQFAIAAQLNGDAANAYLRDRSVEFNATFEVDAAGNITYCFHLGTAQPPPIAPSVADDGPSFGPPHRPNNPAQ
ncbi:hypothetical protein [Halomicronema sp. CCY15110]|uniref:hypothetical protein n=1 Tax=Halomicronema sp. CCY15110 TaxID=2767773 RepID=UPI0019523CF2|nr:hypothetical protein [Halomicronema sp. CCY15110]